MTRNERFSRQQRSTCSCSEKHTADAIHLCLYANRNRTRTGPLPQDRGRNMRCPPIPNVHP
jgi:hypothetical protein